MSTAAKKKTKAQLRNEAYAHEIARRTKPRKKKEPTHVRVPLWKAHSAIDYRLDRAVERALKAGIDSTSCPLNEYAYDDARTYYLEASAMTEIVAPGFYNCDTWPTFHEWFKLLHGVAL